MLKLSLLEIITIVTAFQLTMLGFVLLAKKQQQSNLILSFYMFSNALLLIWFLFSILNMFQMFQMPNVSAFYYLLGPLIFLYVKLLCNKGFRLESGQWVHGFVFLVMLFYSVLKLMLIGDIRYPQWDYYENMLSQSILHAQIGFYVFMSFRTISFYRKEIKNHYSAVEHINLSWLLLIIVAFSAMWLADFSAFLLAIFKLNSESSAYILIVSSISINFIFANFLVYKGLRQPDAFSGLKAPEKYSGSKITTPEIGEFANRLKTFMHEKKPYLNPDLTIKDLSDELGLNYKYLSQVINSRYGQNFYDFINHYRVREAQEIITRNSDAKMTILEILYEVGFNSKSAFNNAFKKNTGKTPSEFKKSIS